MLMGGENLFGDDDVASDDDADFDIVFTKRARDAVVMYDRGCDYGDMFAKAAKSEEDTLEAFREWTKPDDVIKSFYADNAPERKAAARKMKWRMPTATPGQPRS